MFDWLTDNRAIIHILLHGLVPFIVALLFAKKGQVTQGFLLMMSTMLVDVDHLLATPIYQPDRCSILFHPLHQVWAMGIYVGMLVWPWLKRAAKRPVEKRDHIIAWLGAGLVIHMLLDGLDCYWMQGKIIG